MKHSISRRKFLQGTLLTGVVAFSPFLLSGCSMFRSSRRQLPDVADITLQQKIAQMLMIGFRGKELKPGDPIVRDLRDIGIGGVILFDRDLILKGSDRNIASPEQVARLTESCRSYSPFPLFIAIDQEGGRVNRLKEVFGFPPTVSAQSLGTANDLPRTRQAAEGIAALLKREGINMNFVPVVDLNVNPANPVIGGIERSFSADPAIVTAHARETIAAHDRSGVFTCLKHFPGHGSSTADSHKGLTDVSDTWTERELEPYRTLINEGSVKMVMTAHIFNRKLDPDYPATLSNPIMTGILRKKLGFEGVIVSDDMQMGAITQHYSFETAIEKAVVAGVDILDICNQAVYDPDVAPKTIEIVTSMIKRGVITEKRIDESYIRIMKLKKMMEV